MTITATTYPTAREAIEEMEAQGHDDALMVDAGFITCTESETRKLAEAGVDFAYLAADRGGRIMTIPAN